MVVRLITIFIDLKQLGQYKKRENDSYLTNFFEQKEFEDSQKYNAEKKRFSIFYKIIDTAIDLALWLFFFYVAIWNWMDSLMATFGLCSDTAWIGDFIQSYMFLIFMTLLHQLINLPFSIYDTFVIEEKYGFNKMTVGTFTNDQIKTFLLTIILGALVLPVLLWVIAESGNALVPVLAAVSVVFLIIISLLVPTLILPCFFKFSELQDNDLKTAIYRESERTEVPVTAIKVIDGA